MPEPFFTASVPGVPTWPAGVSPGINSPQVPFFSSGMGLNAPGVMSGMQPGNMPGTGLPQPGQSTMVPYAPAAAFGFGNSPFGSAFGQPSWFGSVSPNPVQEYQPNVSALALVASVAARRGQPMGPTSDQDIESVLYDVLEVLAGTEDVEVRCESGRVTLTGTVSAKRLKRDLGEIAWTIPAIADVQNNLAMAQRRRGRPREGEPQAQASSGRKQT